VIDGLYRQYFGRSPSAADAQDVARLVDGLAGGALALPSVRSWFQENPERGAVIVQIYQGLLGRAPTLAEADAWATSDLAIADLRAALLASAERRAAVSSMSVATNGAPAAASDALRDLPLGALQGGWLGQKLQALWNVSGVAYGPVEPRTDAGVRQMAARYLGTTDVEPRQPFSMAEFKVAMLTSFERRRAVTQALLDFTDDLPASNEINWLSMSDTPIATLRTQLAHGDRYKSAAQAYAAQLLDRPASSEELAYWIANEMPLDTLAKALMASAEHLDTTVRRLYVKLLGRVPSAEEVRYYGGSGLDAVAITRALLASPEGKRYFRDGVGVLIDALYRRYLWREASNAEIDAHAASAAGQDPFTYLSDVERTLRDGAERRPFAITAIYTQLDGRLPSDDELSGWLKSATPLDQIADAVAKGPEAGRRRMTAYYRQALGRAPTEAEMAARAARGYDVAEAESSLLGDAGFIGRVVASVYEEGFGRSASTQEVDDWVAIIKASVPRLGRAAIVDTVLDAGQRELSRTALGAAFRFYYGRDPTPAELDQKSAQPYHVAVRSMADDVTARRRLIADYYVQLTNRAPPDALVAGWAADPSLSLEDVVQVILDRPEASMAAVGEAFDDLEVTPTEQQVRILTDPANAVAGKSGAALEAATSTIFQALKGRGANADELRALTKGRRGLEGMIKAILSPD
jgi:hypothetical protein